MCTVYKSISKPIYTYTTLYEDSFGALLERSLGGKCIREWWTTKEIATNLIEYVPPKVDKIFRHVQDYKASRDGYVILSETFQMEPILGTFELTITDGKLTDVRII